ncbi:MAG: redox-sensing transcriptional repressor Rex [Firmicutes bacterium]|nr:redox-sensing transcriptional repressor Rex [Bacillota bacterium]NLL89083.1 redox-sensing transcriptional repressor Rex [Bacillota bacterium]
MRWRKISDAVVRRLPLYLRVLDEVVKSGDTPMISSQELGARAGVGSALVRKDLAWFGEFGKQGVGYEVEYLRSELKQILNMEREHNIILVGAGSLGIALARYTIRRYHMDDSFSLKLVGLFDHDPDKIGKAYEGISVFAMAEMESFVRKHNVQMAMITVPADAAQDIAMQLVNCGVRAILNLAPVKLTLPEHVQLLNADLTLELQRLAYYLAPGQTWE